MGPFNDALHLAQLEAFAHPQGDDCPLCREGRKEGPPWHIPQPLARLVGTQTLHEHALVAQTHERPARRAQLQRNVDDGKAKRARGGQRKRPASMRAMFREDANLRKVRLLAHVRAA